MTITGIDHIAFPAHNLVVAVQFYSNVFGGIVAGEPHYVAGRIAVQRVKIGGALLSIHQIGGGAEPVAAVPVVGSLDMCFAWEGTIASAIALVRRAGLTVIVGPVPRRNAAGQPAESIYVRDPDGNLIELLAKKPAVDTAG